MADQREPTYRPVIVGVSGGSGSGKTTVANRISDSLGQSRVTVIQHDSYYLDRSDHPPDTRKSINYDHPDSLETSLLISHLKRLRRGQVAEIPIYDFANHVRTPKTAFAEPRQVVLVEGILILADSELRDLIDIKVFVDTDPDLRIIRRLERDMSARKRSFDSIVQQYLRTVRKMHLEFVEPSKRYADIIIPEGGYNDVAIDVLLARINSLLWDRIQGGSGSPEPPR